MPDRRILRIQRDLKLAVIIKDEEIRNHVIFDLAGLANIAAWFRI